MVYWSNWICKKKKAWTVFLHLGLNFALDFQTPASQTQMMLQFGKDIFLQGIYLIYSSHSFLQVCSIRGRSYIARYTLGEGGGSHFIAKQP